MPLKRKATSATAATAATAASTSSTPSTPSTPLVDQAVVDVVDGIVDTVVSSVESGTDSKTESSEKRARTGPGSMSVTCPTLENGASVPAVPSFVSAVLKGLSANNFSGDGASNRHCQFYAITHRAIPLVPGMYPSGNKWLPVKLTIVGCKQLGNARAPHKISTEGWSSSFQDGSQPLFEYRSRLSEFGIVSDVTGDSAGDSAGDAAGDNSVHGGSSDKAGKEKIRELVKDGFAGDDHRGVVMYSWEKGAGQPGNRGVRSDDISVLVEIGDSFMVFLNDEDCCVEDPVDVMKRNHANAKGGKGGKGKSFERVNMTLPYPEAFGNHYESRIDPFSLLEISATTKNRECGDKGSIWRCVSIRKAKDVSFYSLISRLNRLPLSVEEAEARLLEKKNSQQYMRDLDEREPLYFVPDVLPTAAVCDDLQCTPCEGREFDLSIPSHVTNGWETAVESVQPNKSSLRDVWPCGFISLVGWSSAECSRVDIPIDIALKNTNSKSIGFTVSLIQMAASMGALSLIVFTNKWWARGNDGYSSLRAIPILDTGKILKVVVDCVIRPSSSIPVSTPVSTVSTAPTTSDVEKTINAYSFKRNELDGVTVEHEYKFVTDHRYDDGEGNTSKILVGIKYTLPSLRSLSGESMPVVTGGDRQDNGIITGGDEQLVPLTVPCDDFLLSQPVYSCEKVIDVGISLKSDEQSSEQSSEEETPVLNAVLHGSKILQCALGGGSHGVKYRRARIGCF